MGSLLALVLISISMLYACQSSIRVAPTLMPTSTSITIFTSTLTPLPTTQPISGGWSTFHTSDYGFSFQYPAVYDRGFYDPAEPLRFCNVQTELKDSEFNVRIGSFIQMTIQETNRNLQEYVNKEIAIFSHDGWQVSSEQITADNMAGVRLSSVISSIDNTMSSWTVRSYFIHNHYAIAIQYYEGSFIGCSPKGINYSLYWVYEQIINTIKFDK